MSVNLVEYQKKIFSHIDEFQEKGDEHIAVRFLSGGIHWAFDAADLVSVNQMPRAPTIIPSAPKYIKGLMQQEGNILSIFDISHLVNEQQTALKKSNRVLVIHPNITTGVAFLVEKTYSLVPIESLIATKSKYHTTWSNTAFKHEDSNEVWHWIHIKDLLNNPAFNTIRRS